MSTLPKSNHNAREALVWQLEAGIDECIGEYPVNRLTVSEEKQLSAKSPSSEQAHISSLKDVLSESNKDMKESPIEKISYNKLGGEVQTAGELASACSTLAELESPHSTLFNFLPSVSIFKTAKSALGSLPNSSAVYSV